MRKLSTVLLAIALVFSLTACNSGTAAVTEAAGSSDASVSETTVKDTVSETNEEKTIYILMGSPEYTDAMNSLIDEYKKVAPNVTIEIEILQDYVSLLKTKFASGNVPDVFQTTVGSELGEFAEYTYDVSNEAYVSEFQPSAIESMTYDGKILGVPFFQLGISLVYNVDMFNEAGITELPKTMSELIQACETLEGKGVTPFINGYKEWWVQKHIFNHYVSASTNDVTGMIEEFKNGETTFAEHPLLDDYFDFIDLSLKYGLPKPLESDLSAEMAAFAEGKGAIVTGQGSWFEDGVRKINPDINMALMPMPVDEDPNHTKIIAGMTHAWRINKDSEVLDEVNAFFNWVYTSDYGKQWFPEVAKCMGCLNGITAPDMQLAESTLAYVEEGKNYIPAMNYSTDGFHQSFGEIIQTYISGSITREEAISEIEAEWQKTF